MKASLLAASSWDLFSAFTAWYKKYFGCLNIPVIILLYTFSSLSLTSSDVFLTSLWRFFEEDNKEWRHWWNNCPTFPKILVKVFQKCFVDGNGGNNLLAALLKLTTSWFNLQKENFDRFFLFFCLQNIGTFKLVFIARTETAKRYRCHILTQTSDCYSIHWLTIFFGTLNVLKEL